MQYLINVGETFSEYRMFLNNSQILQAVGLTYFMTLK